MRITNDDLHRWFGYHPASEQQKAAYHEIESLALELAALMVQLCPASTDTRHAIQLLRQSKMMAVASIACAHVELKP